MGLLLEDIAAYIDTSATFTSGTNLFAGDLPPTPDELVTLYEYPGVGPVDTFGAVKPTVSRPRVQVLARGLSYEVGRALIMEVHALLCAVMGATTVGTGTFHRIAPIQDPFFLSRDESERVSFACNYEIWKVPE